MIYFDNASTTKMDESVKKIMMEAFESTWANPSALHRLGFNSEKRIREARKIISEILRVKDDNLLFVPSATIANNAVIKSATEGKTGNIVISSFEHSSVYNCCMNLNNIEVRTAKVNDFGFVIEEDLLDKIDEKTLMVSIVHVNNEIGSINDVNRLVKIVKEKNPKVLFHSDGVQAFKKIDISLKDIDFYTIASHKINGPKGIAGLYVRDLKLLNPYIMGGGQEKNMFSGTENVQAIIGFAKAVTLENNVVEIAKINNFLREEISKIDGARINSPSDKSSKYILNACFSGIGAEILLHSLEMDDIYISTGSACSKTEKSRTLEAISVDKNYIDGCIRISFDKNSTMEEARFFLEKLREKIEMIRKIVGK